MDLVDDLRPSAGPDVHGQFTHYFASSSLEAEAEAEAEFQLPDEITCATTRKPRCYPIQNSNLPEKMPESLAAMLTKDATFEHSRKGRIFEDKASVIWCKKKRKMFEYYLLSTGEKLDAKFYRVYSEIGATMGVTVVQSGAWGPAILGRSPSMMVSHLRVWNGKQAGFADATMEVVRTLNGQQGVTAAIKKLRSWQQRSSTAPSPVDAATLFKRPRRKGKRATPWWDYDDGETSFENGDEGSFILSDEDEPCTEPPPEKTISPIAPTIRRYMPRKYATPVRICLAEEDEPVVERHSRRGTRATTTASTPDADEGVRSQTPQQSAIAPSPAEPIKKPTLRIILKYRKPQIARQQPTPDEEHEEIQQASEHEAVTCDALQTPNGLGIRVQRESIQPEQNADDFITTAATPIPTTTINVVDDDSESIVEVAATANVVKREFQSGHFILSPPIEADKIEVAFFNDDNRLVRLRPWSQCSPVAALFFQATVGQVLSNSKEPGALVATVPGTEVDDEVRIMKGDSLDFAELVRVISWRQKLKREDGAEGADVNVYVRVEVRSL